MKNSSVTTWRRHCKGGASSNPDSKRGMLSTGQAGLTLCCCILAKNVSPLSSRCANAEFWSVIAPPTTAARTVFVLRSESVNTTSACYRPCAKCLRTWDYASRWHDEKSCDRPYHQRNQHQTSAGDRGQGPLQ